MINKKQLSLNAQQIVNLVAIERRSIPEPKKSELLKWISVFEMLNPIEEDEKVKLIEFLLAKWKWRD